MENSCTHTDEHASTAANTVGPLSLVSSMYSIVTGRDEH